LNEVPSSGFCIIFIAFDDVVMLNIDFVFFREKSLIHIQ